MIEPAARTIEEAAHLATEQTLHLPTWLSNPLRPPPNLAYITQQAIEIYLLHQRPNGGMDGIGWWQVANGYTAIALHDLWSNTNSGRTDMTDNYDVVATAIRACEGRQRGLVNVFNDDSCWWALLCLHMYSLRGDVWFKNVAEGVWRFIREDGSVCQRGQVFFRGEDMEGAVYWKGRKSGNDHINAISTGLYAELSVRLALLRMREEGGNNAGQAVSSVSAETYLETARCCLGWILRCRYRPRKGVVLDHLELGREKAVDWTFTYNTGVALGTCALLYEATRQEDYMVLACYMAQQSMTRRGWVEDNGVLTEKGAYGRGTHDPVQPNDAVGFKSVLMRQLGVLDDVIARTRCFGRKAQETKDIVCVFVNINLQSQLKRNTDGQGRYGPWFDGPFECPTTHSQMAVLDVFATAKLVDRV